ncbi:MAG: type II toxin-antitoxin system HicA family toxin, partial [Rhabdochlamydiaceae bacterium]
VVNAVLTLSDAEEEMREDLNEALAGLSRKKWAEKRGIRLMYDKTEMEFKEQLQANLAASKMIVMQLSDLLRLTEKRIFPAGTISTLSSYFRFIYNVLMIVSESPSSLEGEDFLQPTVYQEFKNVLDLINTYFCSSPFQSVIKFILKSADTLNRDFEYDTWLILLKPMEESLSKQLTDTLQALSHLSKQLLKRVKEHLCKLSLEQLQATDVETIKDTFFNEGLQLLRPLLVLIDMLVLLQQRRFYNEESIIPKELANVMELDGIEELLQELIRAKTPVISREVTPAVEAPVVVEEAPMTEIQLSLPLNIPRVPPAPVLSRQMPSDLQEIMDLNKARKIIARLNNMGFFPVRQTGSHLILHGPTGGQVVVPANGDIQVGTRRSIINQAKAALQGNT